MSQYFKILHYFFYSKSYEFNIFQKYSLKFSRRVTDVMLSSCKFPKVYQAARTMVLSDWKSWLFGQSPGLTPKRFLHLLQRQQQLKDSRLRVTSELENTDPENELTIQNVYLQIVIEPKYLIMVRESTKKF